MPPTAPAIFVIGTASLDTLHLANGQTVHVAGGAGLYTALAARTTGATAGLFAPRPNPLPATLEPVADRLLWLGPVVELPDLPRLEIQHHGRGRATLLTASWGAETRLAPDQLPVVVKTARTVHIAALSSAERQLEFLGVLKKSAVKISVGTYARLVLDSRPLVRMLFEQADFFFMNENEARALFGSVDNVKSIDGTVVFVTLDVEGVLVIQGDQVTHVAGHPVEELDPTGAGDTFCGAVLAALDAGLSPVAAARVAVELAAKTVAALGPSALLT
jgi:ribokinase